MYKDVQLALILDLLLEDWGKEGWVKDLVVQMKRICMHHATMSLFRQQSLNSRRCLCPGRHCWLAWLLFLLHSFSMRDDSVYYELNVLPFAGCCDCFACRNRTCWTFQDRLLAYSSQSSHLCSAPVWSETVTMWIWLWLGVRLHNLSHMNQMRTQADELMWTDWLVLRSWGIHCRGPAIIKIKSVKSNMYDLPMIDVRAAPSMDSE
jgi:hypothetical protein